MGRWLVNGVIFCVAFLAAAAGIREAALERPKYAGYTARAHEIDVAFVGSSHVFRQFEPAVFEAEMAARGRPLKAFNFGMPGMRLAETLHAASEIADEGEGRLRYLFVELHPFEGFLEEENRLTERLVYWHAPAVTLAVCHAILSVPDASLGLRLAWIGDHLTHLGHRVGNVGKGPEVLRALFGVEVLVLDGRPALGERGDGFRPLELETSANYAQRRQLFLRDLDEFRARKEELRDPGGGEVDPATLAIVRAIQRRVEARGIQVVFVVLPVMDRQEGLLALRGTGIPLLAFNDPDAYPEFYRVARRHDMHHLDRKGAQAFTRALAERFAAWLEAESVPPRAD